MGHGAGIMFGTVCSLSTLVSQYVCRGIRLRVTADALSGNALGCVLDICRPGLLKALRAVGNGSVAHRVPCQPSG
jgi:hypothetical protein